MPAISNTYWHIYKLCRLKNLKGVTTVNHMLTVLRILLRKISELRGDSPPAWTYNLEPVLPRTQTPPSFFLIETPCGNFCLFSGTTVSTNLPLTIIKYLIFA